MIVHARLDGRDQKDADPGLCAVLQYPAFHIKQVRSPGVTIDRVRNTVKLKINGAGARILQFLEKFVIIRQPDPVAVDHNMLKTDSSSQGYDVRQVVSHGRLPSAELHCGGSGDLQYFPVHLFYPGQIGFIPLCVIRAGKADRASKIATSGHFHDHGAGI
jgi:hypothetical protein